jgi:2OG-Fe(II) oxygenase superfamily
MTLTHAPVVSLATEWCVVIDDFLPQRLFAEVLRFCNAADYAYVHGAKVQKVWRLHDGLPLRGETYRHQPAQGRPKLRPDGSTAPLDQFVEAVLGAMDRVGDIVGHPVRDWQEMTLAPWVYPAGAGLSLHQDVGRLARGMSYTGSYTYYVNPTWNLHWGGWLMVFEGGSQPPDGPGLSPPWLDDGAEDALVREQSVATAVLPTPNRIVFISPKAPHMITRVDQNAGSHARVSLAGFLQRRDET